MNEIKAKKQFGQNFLIDSTVLTQIIQAMPKSDHIVAEIGPGLGDLTKHLVKVKSVVAFEVDTDLCEHLSKVFSETIREGKLTLHCGDVLARWENKEASLVDAPYDLVANLPYYIATNIILHALNDPRCRHLLVMVQKEVADKFCAQPGEKAYSALGVITQSVARADTVIVVPPAAFNPPPKVDSAVIRITKDGRVLEPGFSSFLKVAFAQPRKTLVKNLSTHYRREQVEACLEAQGLSLTIRPHQTSALEYHQIFFYLKGTLDGRTQRNSTE